MHEEIFPQIASHGFFTYGCLDRHIDGLPATLPFTCFEIPLEYKEMLIFRDINVCIVLHLEVLCQVLEENGYRCRILRHKKPDAFSLELQNNAQKKLGPHVVGPYPIHRMVYECMSVRTFIDYMKESEKLVRQTVAEDERRE